MIMEPTRLEISANVEEVDADRAKEDLMDDMRDAMIPGFQWGSFSREYPLGWHMSWVIDWPGADAIPDLKRQVQEIMDRCGMKELRFIASAAI